MAQTSTKVIGVTGGTGCGQTTVANLFGELGAKVIHADEIGHRILENDPSVRKELVAAFGKSILNRDGSINRKQLGELVFKDQTKLHKLNAIVHPRMIAEVVEEMEEARQSGKYPLIVIDAALIYELSLEHMFDAIVVVTSRLKDRIRRLRDRDGLSEREIMKRIQSQIPVQEKTRWADYVIRNNGTLEDLRHHVEGVYRKILGIGKPTRRRRSVSSKN
ncbi:MAG: dephospho-CoA kinase [Calditrichaeota bacterium]|nr:MAG: dephospho-CoA kinase [Calditrichota bacterium]